MNIYIVRHGQSEANVKGYNEIKEDSKISLTQEGFLQAEDAGKFLAKVVDKSAYGKSLIITSTYLRTLQTTQQIKKSLPLKTTQDSRLVEFDRGIFGKCKYSERKLKFSKEFRKFQNELHSVDKFFAKPPEGECGADVYKRVNPVKYELRQLCKQGVENVIIVTHHDTMRVLTLSLMDYDKLWYSKEKPIQNCSIRHIQLDNKTFIDKGFIYKGYYPKTENKEDLSK